MTTRLDILLDPSRLEPKVAPLLTTDEVLYWDTTLREARVKRATDTGIADYYRSVRVTEMRALDKCQKAQKRPTEYLNALICLVGSRGTRGAVSLEAVYTDELNDLWVQFDSPEARWWVDQILAGLAEIPRSYAKSAAIRYFKGVGKQKGMTKAGAGMFSVENGWKSRELEVVVGTIYDSEFGAPLLQHDSIDPYGAEARQAVEDAWDQGRRDVNRFAMTHLNYDVAFIEALRILLATRGMKAPALGTNPKLPPKPRKEKKWAVGDVMRAKYGPDLPKGAKLRKEGRTPYWADEGYEYIWYGKNTVGTYIIEDERKAVGTYGRYRAISLREVDGMVVTSLPQAS